MEKFVDLKQKQMVEKTNKRQIDYKREIIKEENWKNPLFEEKDLTQLKTRVMKRQKKNLSI